MTNKDCSILINGHQLCEALSFLAPDNTEEQLDQEVIISTGGAECHSGPGLYCWLDEYPEEGAIKLDGTSPAALSAPPAAGVPEGWRLVPIEPTREMREAFHDSYERYEDGHGECPDSQWKAMLRVAPTPPVSEQAGELERLRCALDRIARIPGDSVDYHPSHMSRIARAAVGLCSATSPASEQQRAVVMPVAVLINALERTRDTISMQMELVAARAKGSYLDKTPVMRSLRAHRARCDEALIEYNSELLRLNPHLAKGEGV